MVHDLIQFVGGGAGGLVNVFEHLNTMSTEKEVSTSDFYFNFYQKNAVSDLRVILRYNDQSSLGKKWNIYCSFVMHNLV